MYKRKTKAVFFANRTAKIRTLFIILQNFSEVFLFFSLSAISLFHYVNSARLSSLGKRVQKYTLLVYNPNILNSFFEVFLKEYAKALKDNDVVEHIFYHEWIAGENGTHGIHYYITRGRVSARKREKDAEERNNRNYSRITDEKRQQEERDDIEGKQENEPNVKRILGIYHKGTLQKEIIKGDGLIGMVNWA